MSTTEWTNPVTKEKYPIGTVGIETNYTAIKSSEVSLDAVREFFPGVEAAAKFFLRDAGYGADIPTYGYWAGKGWSSGRRYELSESGDIKWDIEPCYNETIKQISTNPDIKPENCISLVDAITKTHDWMYDQAEKKYGKDTPLCKRAYFCGFKLQA